MTIKLTQSELKRQRDALRQYERYLPNLQLKKQLLQLEIVHLQNALRERENRLHDHERESESWQGLLAEAPDIRGWLIPEHIITEKNNVAGVEIPVFVSVVFSPAEYDLFLTPLWVDSAIPVLQQMISLREEIRVKGEGVTILKNELRITTQRVNLFEKVKIPEAKDAIRRIKIYIGDQMTTAVCRSKIAKGKIQELSAGEMA
jgi:V/A-type H+-transporting ATPase subunit D